MTLPPNAAFQTLVGPLSRNSHLAKQQVCLEACKKLHQMGALDDRLLPCIEQTSEKAATSKGKESSTGASAVAGVGTALCTSSFFLHRVSLWDVKRAVSSVMITDYLFSPLLLKRYDVRKI